MTWRQKRKTSAYIKAVLTISIRTAVGACTFITAQRSGSSNSPDLRPATEPIRVWHLLTHTSGLTYGFHYAHPVDAMYRAAGFVWGNPPGVDLAGCCDLWAAQPLVFEPGSEWNYGVSTDVLGRLVELKTESSHPVTATSLGTSRPCLINS